MSLARAAISRMCRIEAITDDEERLGDENV
jgi:hypothetical protein